MELRNRRYQIGAVAVAIGILIALINPFLNANAFVADLTLPNADPSNVPRSAVGSTFEVTIDVAPGELISIDQIQLLLDNETPEVKHAVFEKNPGESSVFHRVSGDPNLTRGNLKIDVSTESGYGYGYGYGNGYGYGYGYAETGYAETMYGYGYGYGPVSYGKSYAPPYTYSFESSQDFLSGNTYGYNYAVPNANLVQGFVGPATITIEGKINTALLDPGTHTLDVLVHTGSGGNGVDKIVPPQLEFNVGGPAAAVLTVESADSEGNPINGVWTTIRSAEDDKILKLGFSPVTFVGDAGASYKVTVADYNGRVFQNWEDDSTERTRTIELEEGETTITATHDLGDSMRGFTSMTYPTSEDIHHSLTVDAASLENDPLNIYTIIDPVSSDESETTYNVYVHNYLDNIFRNWEDDSTSNVRTITIDEDTTITASYQVDEQDGVPDVEFAAPLHGSQEVPPVTSDLDGEAILILNEDETELRYSLIVSPTMADVTAAHIHLAPPGENGEVVAQLFDPATQDASTGLVQGTITSSDLVGPLEGSSLSDLIAEMQDENTYVNVHTTQNPDGEIRGQILFD